ncbi:MAG: hypothetical protein KGK16_06955, partial [Bradyrhizobium sp.]|nr:hypothetical protein [Bradyrhizobium sp.]
MRYRRSRTGADRRPARTVGFRALLIVAGGAGFTKVYSAVDGYEGDLAATGPRSDHARHGWKNVGLPWSFRLDKAKMYKINNE